MKIIRVRQFADLLRRDADQVLLYEAMKIFAFLLMLFVFECGFAFDGGVSQMLKIAQFKSARGAKDRRDRKCRSRGACSHKLVLLPPR